MEPICPRCGAPQHLFDNSPTNKWVCGRHLHDEMDGIEPLGCNYAEYLADELDNSLDLVDLVLAWYNAEEDEQEEATAELLEELENWDEGDD